MAGSDSDEHIIRGKATRAYLPFHDGCHHLSFLHFSSQDEKAFIIAEAESFFFCFRKKKVLEESCHAHKKEHHESH